AELAELLLGERTQRRRVDRRLAARERLEDAGLGHERLAGPRRYGDEHVLVGEDLLERLLLHRVRLEVLGEDELLVEVVGEVGAHGPTTERSFPMIRSSATWFSPPSGMMRSAQRFEGSTNWRCIGRTVR